MNVNEILISNIKPYEKNAKKHTIEQIEKIAQSIKEYGFKQPIVIDKDNVIIIGHARYEAGRMLELKKVPAIIASDLTPKQVKKLRILDNKLNESEWDYELLKEDLTKDELLDFDFDLDVLGFEEEDTSEKDDAVPDVPEEPKSKLGDLYQLGEHRLLCGDATKKEDVERLMDGQKADMVFTDPPYNIDYGVSKNPRHKIRTMNPRHKIRTIENDKQSDNEWESFCKALFLNFKEFNKGDIYMWGASSPEGMKMRLWLTEMGCHWSATIIWNKNRLVLTPANYQRKYEPCFYGWFDKSSFDRKKRTETEVWDMERPHSSKLHPTMKPVELCMRGIKNSSKYKNIIMDLFGGSGSTLIACEKTDRKCYMLELDPKYCDVIIQRWEDFTGDKAVKIN